MSLIFKIVAAKERRAAEASPRRTPPLERAVWARPPPLAEVGRHSCDGVAA